jgi:ABC-2 type transport system ATP-binding protein
MKKSREIISANNLTKKFDNNVVVKNVSFVITRGTITGIIGRNGSGKTVLLKMMVQLYFPTTGEVKYEDGISVVNDFGVLIDTGFLENETGFKNLEILANLKSKISKNDIFNIMNYVKLDPWNKTKYKNYSTGMKQKLKIAQALMENPSVLILDEPFNGLDKESVKYFRKELLALKESDITIVITSHYQEDIDQLCDVVYEMIDGGLKIYEKEN